MGRDEAPEQSPRPGEFPGGGPARPGLSVALTPDGQATITIGARLEAAQRVAFHRAYDELLRDARIRSMSVDLRTVEFLHHDALGMLLVLADTAGLAGVPLSVNVLPGPVLDKLRMMDMGRWFSMQVDVRNTGALRLEIGRGGRFFRYRVEAHGSQAMECERETEAVLDLAESLQLQRVLVDCTRHGLPRDPEWRLTVAAILESRHPEAWRVALLVAADSPAELVADALELKALMPESVRHVDIFQDEAEAAHWLSL